jgi:hypothetical protein
MAAKRFQTYFNIPIPPPKREKMGSGQITIRFVLTGNIISKKNNSQAVTIRKYAREHIKQWAEKKQQKSDMVSLKEAVKVAQSAVSMCISKIRGNMEYLAFLEHHRPIVQHQMQEWAARLQDKGLIFPLSKVGMTFRLCIKDKYRRDVVNAQQTIQDLLVDCGVLIDDNDEVLNKYTGESARYYEELIHNIAFISLSFKPEVAKTKN